MKEGGKFIKISEKQKDRLDIAAKVRRESGEKLLRCYSVAVFS